MFFFTIKSIPKEDNKDVSDEISGAYVNAWINFPDQEVAEIIARHYIDDAGWIAELVTEIRITNHEDCEGQEDEQYFNEALEDGSSFVFHTWPKDAEDSDCNYEQPH